MEHEKITEAEMKEALGRSGYFLETRTLAKLHAKNYSNTPNKTYPDSITGKSRELDIYAESARITENIELNHYLHFEFQHRLIIECANNPQPAIFFKRPDKSTRSIFGKFQYSKLERALEGEEGFTTADHHFHEYTTSSKHFHYNNFKANTQYCSFTPKKGNKEWMASHPDGLHDTFNKLFDCTSHTKLEYMEWMPNSAWNDEVFVVLFFPLLILQNDLFEAKEHEGDISLESKKHIVFEFNRYNTKNESCLIDVITEDYLEPYLDTIENDIQKMKRSYLKFYSGKSIKNSMKAERLKQQK